MSIEPAAAVPAMSALGELAPLPLAEAPGGLDALGPQAAPDGGLGAGSFGMAGLAGALGVTAATDTWAQAHAETAPWGNPADELAAGGQLRSLAEMARDLARGSPALAQAEAAAGPRQDAAPGAGLAPGVAADAALAAPAAAAAATTASPATLMPHVLPALHPGITEPPRQARDEAPALREPPLGWPQGRRRGGEHAGDDEGEDGVHPDGDGPTRDDAGDSALRAPAAEPAPEPPWAAPLLAGLHDASADPAAHAALQAAAEAWARGRAVLLACLASPADANTGWLHVLRALPPARGQAPGALRLTGERLAARLRWAHPAGAAPRWWQVRMAKSYSLRRGGQLVAQDARADGQVACELQLGPFPALLPRWRDVLVRVDHAPRLWQALGTQWSLPLLVCDRALYAGPAPSAAPVTPSPLP